MSENDETTKRLSSEASAEGGHTIEDVFRLVVSMNDRLIRLEDRFEAHRAEFVEFRDKVDSRLLKMTTPLSETLEAIRGDIRQVRERQDQFAERQDTFAERQDAFAAELADVKRIVRKIDYTVGEMLREMYAIKGEIHDHEGRLIALEERQQLA